MKAADIFPPGGIFEPPQERYEIVKNYPFHKRLKTDNLETP